MGNAGRHCALYRLGILPKCSPYPDGTSDHEQSPQGSQNSSKQKCAGGRRLRQRQDSLFHQAESYAMPFQLCGHRPQGAESVKLFMCRTFTNSSDRVCEQRKGGEKHMNQTKRESGITALYERLSRDDDSAGESNSIPNQKRYLEDYARQHGFTNIRHYSDDGYTGTNFAGVR